MNMPDMLDKPVIPKESADKKPAPGQSTDAEKLDKIGEDMFEPALNVNRVFADAMHDLAEKPRRGENPALMLHCLLQ
jgi:hypothetical protein